MRTSISFRPRSYARRSWPTTLGTRSSAAEVDRSRTAAVLSVVRVTYYTISEAGMDRRAEIDLAQEVGPLRVDANEARSLWVIGHRVTLLPGGGRGAAPAV